MTVNLLIRSFKLRKRPIVQDRLGIAKTTLQNQMNEGLMTPPVSTGGARGVAWPEHEIDEVVRARIAGKSNEEIKALVTELVAQRGELA
jgi:prophage regulatory protein